MECSCNASPGMECYEDVCWGKQLFKAAKEHVCYECGKIISKKEEFEFHTVFYENGICNYKICPVCSDLIHHFFPDGWIFGSVREGIKEHLSQYWSGDLPSNCVSQLSPSARDFVCDELQQYQE